MMTTAKAFYFCVMIVMYKTSESQHVIIMILLKPFGPEQKPTLQPPFLEVVIQRVLYSE